MKRLGGKDKMEFKELKTNKNIKLEKEAYGELLKQKAEIIIKEGKNITLSETVLRLCKLNETRTNQT